MTVKKQVVVVCDICGRSMTYPWNSFSYLGTALARARANNWQIGKKGVFCPEHRTKSKKGRADNE